MKSRRPKCSEKKPPTGKHPNPFEEGRFSGGNITRSIWGNKVRTEIRAGREKAEKNAEKGKRGKDGNRNESCGEDEEEQGCGLQGR